jgi:ubiquinone/menaquinone biosynthesis C-methylase UbiE
MQYFLERGKDIRGIEPVAQLIKQAERKGIPPGIIQLGSGYSLPYADNSIDACIECAVLHHVARPDRVVSEMMRVARRGIFLVDSNRLGDGCYVARITKLVLYKLGLWKAARFIQTGGRMYSFTERDGVAYSYSVFDSYHQLAKWQITYCGFRAITTDPLRAG